MSEVTRIIRAVAEGRAEATVDLFPLVYRELKRMAAARFGKEMPGHTLQPTALVHEAYLRLIEPEEQNWENRSHFFGAAATAMRRILVDHARSKRRLKRGGDYRRVEFDDVEDFASKCSEDLLALDEGLDALRRIDSEKAELVKLKFFSGLTTREAGELLGMPERTAERQWAYARVWLQRYMQEQP